MVRICQLKRSVVCWQLRMLWCYRILGHICLNLFFSLSLLQSCRWAHSSYSARLEQQIELTQTAEASKREDSWTRTTWRTTCSRITIAKTNSNQPLCWKNSCLRRLPLDHNWYLRRTKISTCVVEDALQARIGCSHDHSARGEQNRRVQLLLGQSNNVVDSCMPLWMAAIKRLRNRNFTKAMAPKE